MSNEAMLLFDVLLVTKHFATSGVSSAAK